MKTLVGCCLILLVTLNAQAQKLDRLRERATSFWSLRLAGNSTEYLKFVDPSSRTIASQWKEPRFLSAQVSGIEFSDIPTLATVVTSVGMFTVEMGEVRRSMRETWVWNGKDWFLKPQGVDSLFASLANPAAAITETPLELEFSKTEITLGSHPQGEVVSGVIEFKTERSRISKILPADSADLLFGEAEWKDDRTASMRFTFDTTLHAGTVNRNLKFRILDLRGKELLKTLTLRADIQGKVRFTQVPEPLDTSKAGVVEILIQNLGPEPIRITSVTNSSDAFRISEDLKENLAIGEISIIKLNYTAQRDQEGTTLLITFSKPILGKSTISFPLQTRPLVAAPAQYTPEQLDRLRPITPKPPPDRN